MANPSILLTQPFAESGDKNIIPATTTGIGAMSQAYGFPTETSLPIGQGGVAPTRKDFNGAFYMLGLYAMMAQRGGVWQYNALQNYEVPAFVQDPIDNCYYFCLAANGPSTTVVAPHADGGTYWKKIVNANGSIAGLIPDRAIITDNNGAITPSAVTATELGYLDGVTSNVQTQLNRKVSTLQELSSAVTASGATTLTFDITKAIIPVTISGATTFSFNTTSAGMTSGNVYTFELILTMPATVYSLTFPASVTWLEEPDFSVANKKYIVVLRTYDQGTTWVSNAGGIF